MDSPLLRARWRKFSRQIQSPPRPRSKLVLAKPKLPGIIESNNNPKKLLRSQSEFSFLDDYVQYPNNNPPVSQDLMNAIQEDDVKKLKRFVKDKKINVNTLDRNGAGPIHEACYQGNLKCLEVLLSNGADVNLPDFENWTGLHAAVCGQELECVKYMFYNGANINCVTDTGWSPLHMAVYIKNLEIIHWLTKAGANVLLPAENWLTPFQLAVDLTYDEAVTYFLYLPYMQSYGSRDIHSNQSNSDLVIPKNSPIIGTS